MLGSRSAPIGTPSLLAFSMSRQSARSDSIGGPIPVLKDALAEALSILEKLEQEQKLAAAQKDWPNMIWTALSKRP